MAEQAPAMVDNRNKRKMELRDGRSSAREAAQAGASSDANDLRQFSDAFDRDNHVAVLRVWHERSQHNDECDRRNLDTDRYSDWQPGARPAAVHLGL